MLYTIQLQDMEFKAYHGCYDLEQKVGNRFNVALTITTHLGDVAQEDAVEKAVNYLTVYEIVEVECTVAKLAPPLGGKIGRVSVTLKG